MGGAIAVGLLAFQFARTLTASLLGEPLRLPSANRVGRRLLPGGLLFGVGWGIAGLCPGTALMALGSGEIKAVLFVATMLAGMGLFEVFEWRARLASSIDTHAPY